MSPCRNVLVLDFIDFPILHCEMCPLLFGSASGRSCWSPSRRGRADVTNQMDLCGVMPPTFSGNRNAAKRQPPVTNPIRGLLWGAMGRLKQKHTDKNNSFKIRIVFCVTVAAAMLFSIATDATVCRKHFTTGIGNISQRGACARIMPPFMTIIVTLLNDNIYALPHPVIRPNSFVEFVALQSGGGGDVLDFPSCGLNQGSSSRITSSHKMSHLCFDDIFLGFASMHYTIVEWRFDFDSNSR